MRRVIMIIGGTIAGVAALLSFKTHSAADAAAASMPSLSGSTNSGSGGTAAGSTRSVTGQVANTPYGPMQVQLILAGQQITKVNVLQQTGLGPRSSQIDSFAVPQLNSETLAAQSARIVAVSGASYTSQGYIQSLQSAVDAARL